MKKNEERERTMEAWQERWQETPKAQWTRSLITDIRKWTNRVHGNVTYHMVQMLSGHGSFEHYLNRIG